MIDMKIMIISTKKALKCKNEFKTTKKRIQFIFEYESPFIPPKIWKTTLHFTKMHFTMKANSK